MLRWALAFILLALPGAAQTSAVNCNEVQAGTAQGYACLNQQLGAIAKQTARPSSLDAPYSATSPSNVTGQYNQAGTRERLDANFGKSAIPARPVTNFPPAFAPK